MIETDEASAALRIRPFETSDTESVVDLWTRAGLTRPWNDPRADIRHKQSQQPELFLVAESDAEVVGVIMAGDDGHRGWVTTSRSALSGREQAWGALS